MNLGQVLKLIRMERNRLQEQAKELERALSALRGSRMSVKPRAARKNKMSAASRKRIADAQKARWSKWRRLQKKK
jgi:hypothetical protein